VCFINDTKLMGSNQSEFFQTEISKGIRLTIILCLCAIFPAILGCGKATPTGPALSQATISPATPKHSTAAAPRSITYNVLLKNTPPPTNNCVVTIFYYTDSGFQSETNMVLNSNWYKTVTLTNNYYAISITAQPAIPQLNVSMSENSTTFNSAGGQSCPFFWLSGVLPNQNNNVHTIQTQLTYKTNATVYCPGSPVGFLVPSQPQTLTTWTSYARPYMGFGSWLCSATNTELNCPNSFYMYTYQDGIKISDCAAINCSTLGDTISQAY